MALCFEQVRERKRRGELGRQEWAEGTGEIGGKKREERRRKEEEKGRGKKEGKKKK